ncbi:MAG: hypothetical protein IT372_32435 [Polyangiaceae bacterium]|nr:hypothetical protein [Polyangiaceae bacterium]
MADGASTRRRSVERVQTGLRLERRVLLVLKGLSASLGMSLGDLIEGIVLHAFEGKAPFSPQTLELIAALRAAHGLDLTADDSHRLVEARAGARRRRGASGGGGSHSR